jgi:trk system potassium uptake protein TrkH
MRDFLPLAHVLGRLLMLFSLAYVVPIAGSFFFHDGLVAEFTVSMLVTLGVGLALFAGTRRHYRELKVRDGFLLVTFSWIFMAAVATLPLLAVYPGMSLTDAFFETMSALTTTGATVLTGLDHAPRSINLWRCLLQWLGGLGIIVLAVAILPLLGVGGMQLFRAEMPGPMKEARLTARIADTAKALWLAYVGLSLACMLSLRVAGMSWFDAICHGFSTVALGGFSTRDASNGAFEYAAIEMVVVLFTVLGAMNFATHFLAFRTRNARCYLNDAEARALVAVVAASCLAVAAFLLWKGVYPDFATALRHATFNLVSIGLTSGFASVDYAQWPLFVPVLMLFLASITPSSGSTGSGIKMVRTIILYKQGLRELHKMLHPASAELNKLGDVPVPNKVTFSVLGFIFLYFMTVALTTFVLLASGMDFLTAVSAAVSCINNIGPALGELGPAANFGGISDFQKWTCLAAMLLGRLEILSVLVIFTRSFWRK